MNISSVKEELARAVGAVSGVNTFSYIPDSLPVPCFLAGEVEIRHDNTFGAGCDVAQVKCYVLVGRQDDRAGQRALDQYLSRTGANSVRAAILAAKGTPGELALNGQADDLRVERIDGYRTYQFGDSLYYGAELTILVIGS